MDRNFKWWNSGGVGKDFKPFKLKRVETHDNHIHSIRVDELGFVWVAYEKAGIECFKNGKSIGYFPHLPEQ
ncbi:MAG: hypothetical protein M3R25_05215 [Bacteroidota bacterium]|nr:hypothetical protein [Bacteroidota bacterium]